MSAALKVFADASCGSITRLPFQWSDNDDWKAELMGESSATDRAENTVPDAGVDDRVERFDTPQYQTAADEAAADPQCPSCIWLSTT